MPTDRADPLAHQNIRDRFYGQDDPVAAKMMAKQDELPKLEPPEDEGISSLWLGNMSADITPEVRFLTVLVVLHVCCALPLVKEISCLLFCFFCVLFCAFLCFW